MITTTLQKHNFNAGPGIFTDTVLDQAADQLTFIASNHCPVVFTLCPLAVEELITGADAGKNLPKKSTWINPKVPYGLILYKHQPFTYETH
ncbi:MAG: hypothetical protein JWQ79_2039 [Mucilaginibacter sp.]|nr:hypothetical protein [Mucilaginibacter sp.]